MLHYFLFSTVTSHLILPQYYFSVGYNYIASLPVFLLSFVYYDVFTYSLCPSRLVTLTELYFWISPPHPIYLDKSLVDLVGH